MTTGATRIPPLSSFSLSPPLSAPPCDGGSGMEGQEARRRQPLSLARRRAIRARVERDVAALIEIISTPIDPSELEAADAPSSAHPRGDAAKTSDAP